MVELTKKQFECLLLFLQKLYYNGYITEAERDALGHAVKRSNNTIWCNYETTVENRCVTVGFNYKKLGLLQVNKDFIVFEDENRNIKCDILEVK